MSELTLRYNGDEEAFVQVTQRHGGEDVVLFEGFVEPGDPFTFEGATRNGSMGTQIKIFVDDKLAERVHTSCSEPIGPGLVAGDFEVIDGFSRKGGRLCPMPGSSGGDCGECDGKVSELTLRYNGDEEAFVQVTQRHGGEDVVLFEGFVEPGDPLTFEGAAGNGSMGTQIKIFVDDKLAERVHTSCSEPIGPGLVIGDFEVIEGSSRKGGPLCPLPGSEEECGECDGQATELTLRYHGAGEVFVQVTQKLGGEDGVIFEDYVESGEAFTVRGASRRDTLGSMIKIFVDDALAERIHTSCSEPIGPGLVVGDFEVIDGASRNGGPFCPLPDDEGCDECQGQVSELTLRYNGDVEAFIQIFQRIDDQEVLVFEEFVEPGGPFTFAGDETEGSLGPSVDVVVDDEVAATIDTSCFEAIGPGLVVGDFEVLEGYSSETDERLCPLAEEECGECAGQVNELALLYNGVDEVFVQVIQKVGGEDTVLFEDYVEPGDLISFEGANSKGTMGSMVRLHVDDELVDRIHTSCSRPIGPGLVIADFEVVEGTSRNGGLLCPVP